MIIADQDELFAMLRRRGPSDRYEWNPRPGFDFERKASAEEVGKRIEEMAEANGGVINTTMLTADGDNPRSPLYPLFEHDIEVAAHNWRSHEARNLIGSLSVVKVVGIDPETEQPQVLRVRAFPHVMSDGENCYTPVYVAAKVPDLQQQIVRKLASEARAWQRRAKDFGIFSNIVSAIEQLPEQP